MIRERRFTVRTVILVGIVLFCNSCAYDTQEKVDPAVPCDIGDVTFALTIKPILQANCIECHSGSAPSGDLDYEKYTTVQQVAMDGRLVGAINHRPGFQPMPRFAPKLPECEIMKIEKWVTDGALNN
jgi:mono/diheme cytochrome c family protein